MASYEVRVEKMVSLNDEKSAVRIARFLKPCTRKVRQAAAVPDFPLLSEIFSHRGQQWPSTVDFKGWREPQERWAEWVDSVAKAHSSLGKSGVFHAVKSSKYWIPYNKDLILGLVEYWCPETNSFVFPWGEATITLEDVMVLGGYSVLGDKVTIPLSEDLKRIENKLKKIRSSMFFSNARKPSHDEWLKHFTEEKKNGEILLEGFFSLWLSRYVFPSESEDLVGIHVFPIAVHLCQGRTLALAPAVLAGIYENLTCLKEQAMSCCESITVWGPFQLVQQWAFERFPPLRPNSCSYPKIINEPRAARWHKLKSTTNLRHIRSVLELAKNFEWRPYAADFENWLPFRLYSDSEQIVVDGSNLEWQSYMQCLCASELTGLSSVEKYMPHRVAMQFGMDQDLPTEFTPMQINKKSTSFLVPAKSYQPCVSLRYFNWWKKMRVNREHAVNAMLEQKQERVGFKQFKTSGNAKQVKTEIGLKRHNDLHSGYRRGSIGGINNPVKNLSFGYRHGSIGGINNPGKNLSCGYRHGSIGGINNPGKSLSCGYRHGLMGGANIPLVDCSNDLDDHDDEDDDDDDDDVDSGSDDADDGGEGVSFLVPAKPCQAGGSLKYVNWRKEVKVCSQHVVNLKLEPEQEGIDCKLSKTSVTAKQVKIEIGGDPNIDIPCGYEDGSLGMHNPIGDDGDGLHDDDLSDGDSDEDEDDAGDPDNDLHCGCSDESIGGMNSPTIDDGDGLHDEDDDGGDDDDLSYGDGDGDGGSYGDGGDYDYDYDDDGGDYDYDYD